MTRTQAEYFCRVWMTTETMKEAAELLGMDERKVSNNAAHLRRLGIPLPCNKVREMPSRTGKPDLSKKDKEDLIQLIRQLEEDRERAKRVETSQKQADKYRKHAG